MKTPTLKTRISLLVTVVLIAVIATVSTVAYDELREWSFDNMDRELLPTANAVLAELDKPHTREDLAARAREVTGYSSHRRSPRFRVWYDGSQADLIVSDPADSKFGRWLRELPSERRPGLVRVEFVDLGRRKDEFRAIWMRRRTDKGIANIVVAFSSRYVIHELHEFLMVLLILGGCMAGGSALVARALVWWAMRPIGQTAGRLDEVTHRNLGREHLADLKAPGELKPFISAVSGLLGRLDKALQRQKQFTADASHELRTPLSLAKSTLQVARTRDGKFIGYQQAIDETLEDLNRMERLIHQLLILARVDAPEAIAQVTELSLDALLYELALAFDEKASQSGGNVVCENLPSTRVRGEEGLLSTLFSNLLSNAIEHGPSGGTVRVTVEHGSDGHCTACIHDEGGKIPPEAIPHLFDRFYRVDSSHNRATGGAGLGLAISREIARWHGGDITIESNPAMGTLVTVRLPRL